MTQYIKINGKKYAIEKDGEPEAPAEAAPVEPVAEPVVEKPAEDVGEQAKAIGKIIANEIMSNINVEAKANTKIAELIKGKDLTDKNSLTPEEKIVGFYHALVNKDHAVCKALSEGTAADGGYLFPDEFRAEIIKSLVGPFRMRGMVRVIPMNRDIMKIPTVTARPKLYWTAENEVKTTTSAEFYEATLTARKMAAIIYASDELVEDSDQIDVVRLVIDLFADAIADEEDRVILQGNGTTQPTGVHTAVDATTIATRTCAGNLDADDIIDLTYDLPQAYRPNAKMVAARANIRELRKLKDSNGQYLWQPSVQAGQPDMILGYPVIENDYMGEDMIVIGDWKMGYWLGDRREMTVKISQDTETAFTKDQTAIRVVERIAGNVVLADAFRALISIP